MPLRVFENGVPRLSEAGGLSVVEDGTSAGPANGELREDGSYELREDGSYELRED